ncbi:MAG: hypothetical protein ABL940_12120 [Bacteroidia bacterium]
MLPLFFINIKTSHDWGDDFAQYIHQAKNISEGISQNTTGYIFNPERAVIGPKAYPTGMPLLLAPLVKHYGYNYTMINYYTSFFLALSGLFGFVFLRKHFSMLTSLFTILIISYGAQYLDFKMELFSDIPFTCFWLACLCLILSKKNIYTSILLGLLLAFSVHIRSVGLVIVGVFVIHEFMVKHSYKSASIQLHKNTLLTLISFLLLYISLKLMFPCNTNYPSLLSGNDIWERSNGHISNNLLNLLGFFNIYAPQPYYYISILSSASLITFSVLGFMYEFKVHKLTFVNMFVICLLYTSPAHETRLDISYAVVGL